MLRKPSFIRRPVASRPVLASRICACAFACLSLVAPIGVARASGLHAHPISVHVSVARSVVSSGETQTLTEIVRSDRSIKGAVVDLEVYDHAGRKVFQAAKSVTVIARQPLTVVARYTLPRKPTGGAYRVEAGVFGKHWKPMYTWADAAGRFAVVGSTPLAITVTGQVDPRAIWPGNTKLITATVAVSYASLTHALVDIEVYDGKSRVCQVVKKGITIPAGHVFHLTRPCRIAPNRQRGTYVVRIGVFSNDWHTMYSWNFYAATFPVQ